jgi:hypothetical protein
MKPARLSRFFFHYRKAAMTDIFIFLLFIGVVFAFIGLKSFVWGEKPGDKTHPAVAVLMTAVGGCIAYFMARRLLMDLL